MPSAAPRSSVSMKATATVAGARPDVVERAVGEVGPQ